MGILPGYYFFWKDLEFYIKKEEDKWWNISTAMTSPNAVAYIKMKRFQENDR